MYLVREAAPTDALGIADVHVRSWQAAYRGQMPDAFLDQLDVHERARRWATILSSDDSLEWVATNAGGSIVAFASLMPSRDANSKDTAEDTAEGTLEGALELAALYVAPEHLRHGIGTLLMEAVDARARDLEARVMTLWVLESNTAARRFYEAHDFTPDGAVKLDDRFGDFTLRKLRYRRRWDEDPERTEWR